MKDKPAITFLRLCFDLLFGLLTRPQFAGLENVPRERGVLLVTNHLSYADPPFIFIALRQPNLTVLIADKYKSNPLFRWIAATVGGVWINRGSGDRAALRAAVDVLKKDRLLGMAPEGTRSRDTHALQPGKTGAAFIASRAGVPILPVGLTGTERIFSELKRLRRARITFRAGPPFALPALEGDARSRQLERHTHEIMCRIAALLPEEYHGVYRGDPRIEEIRRSSATAAPQAGDGA